MPKPITRPSKKLIATPKEVRIGLIVNDTLEKPLISHLIKIGKKNKRFSINLLIFQLRPPTSESNRTPNSKLRFIKNLLDGVAWTAFRRLERSVSTHDPACSYLTKGRKEQLDVDTISVAAIRSNPDNTYGFDAETQKTIKAKSLDVLVDLTGTQHDKDVCSLCRLGIISLRYNRSQTRRSHPPAFWEVYFREAVTKFSIVHSPRKASGSITLIKGAVPTARYYTLNLAQLQRKACAFLPMALKKATSHQVDAPGEPATLGTCLGNERPTARHLFCFVNQTILYAARKLLRKLTGRTRRWSIAYQFASDWKSSELHHSTVIKNPPNHYLADPFPISRDGRHICYAEDYDYGSSRGKIIAYEITKDGHHPLGTAVEESFHLSYPYIFTANNELFMCPETHQAGQIRLYRCTRFPLEWTLHRVLMEDVNAVDTNIFFWSGRWWMLTNLDTADMDDHCSELHLFHADTFDSESWQAHPLNPIIFDPERARNGGLLVDGGAIYRVFQVQGFDLYGCAAGIAQITELTPTTYREKVLRSVPPRFFDGIDGTHTFSFNGHLLTVDFARLEEYRS